MPFENVHLRKTIRFLASDARLQRELLLRDIREELRDGGGGGGDFYSPFWADAKQHILGNSDLSEETAVRVEANSNRRRLYPALRDGFLEWWTDQTNRWGNQGFQLTDVTRKGAFDVQGLDCHIKVHNLLTFEVGASQRLVYPYWFHDQPLIEEYARMILVGMQRAFPDDDPNTFKVLDVERGAAYSGNEIQVSEADYTAFVDELSSLVALREQLLRDR